MLFMALTISCIASVTVAPDCISEGNVFSTKKACEDFAVKQTDVNSVAAMIVNGREEVQQHMMGLTACMRFTPSWAKS